MNESTPICPNCKRAETFWYEDWIEKEDESEMILSCPRCGERYHVWMTMEAPMFSSSKLEGDSGDDR